MAGSIEEPYGAKAQRVKRAANGIVPVPRDRVSAETVKRVARAFKLSSTEFPLPSVLHALQDILEAYDVFGRAAETKALKVMINA